MPNNRTKNIIKETAWFAFGNFGSKILSFLLVPLYTSILSTNEYGTIDIIITTISLAIPLLTLSLQDAAFRYAMESGIRKASVITDCLLITVASPILLLLLFPIIDTLLPVLTEYWWYFFAIYVFNSVSSVLSCYLKGIGKSNIFAIQGIVYTFVFCLANVVFLLFINLGIEGYLLSLLLAHIFSCIYMIIAGKVSVDLSFDSIDLPILKEMLKFSLPLIPASVAWWVMTSIDRYMLLYMCGAEANGLYSVAHKFPTVISVVMTFFINAWQITAVRNKDDSDMGEFTSVVYEKLFCIGLVLAYVMILISRLLGQLFFANDFFFAWTMMPLLTVSTIFSTLSLFLGAQFTASKRSDLHLKSNLISMLANIILNYVLIKCMGINGAAYGTMLSYFIVLVYRMLKTKELIELTINTRKMYAMCLFLMISATLTSIQCLGYSIITILLLGGGILSYRTEIREIFSAIYKMLINQKSKIRMR